MGGGRGGRGFWTLRNPGGPPAAPAPPALQPPSAACASPGPVPPGLLPGEAPLRHSRAPTVTDRSLSRAHHSLTEEDEVVPGPQSQRTAAGRLRGRRPQNPRFSLPMIIDDRHGCRRALLESGQRECKLSWDSGAQGMRGTPRPGSSSGAGREVRRKPASSSYSAPRGPVPASRGPARPLLAGVTCRRV